jgi:hypothetical protein
MFTLESKWEKHQSVALRLSPAVCTSNDSLNNRCVLLSFRFSLSLSSHIWWAKAQILNIWRDDVKCAKEKKKRTNKSASLCWYSSYRRRTITYTFFFPSLTIESVVSERTTLCLCSFLRPVRFLAIIHSFIRTNPGKEPHVCLY